MRILKYLAIIVIALSSRNANAQLGEWTWMHGTQNGTGAGVYGTKGVPNAANYPEGRYQCAYWTDTNGNFWLFGGVTLNGEQNDLWKYDVSTNMWTWMSGPQGNANPSGVFGTKGVPSAANYPSSRGWGANCWTDKDNNLWLFCGFGTDGSGTWGSLNDLWRYNIATNEWTWMNGEQVIANIVPSKGAPGLFLASNAMPDVNECKSSWVTSNNHAWFFGGSQGMLGLSNDLWQYDPSINQYAFMKGDGGVSNNYGTKGVESPANLPPGRFSYTKWQDAEDNLYIYGGSTTIGGSNDVWKYSTVTNNWTWISGSNVGDNQGVYAAKCKQEENEYPSARYENQTAGTLGCVSLFWTFGGFLSGSTTADANDLWLFNSNTSKWTWVSGDAAGTTPTEVYGTLGVSAPANKPGGRGGVAIWADKQNNVWVYGGMTIGINFYRHNDLWRFIPDTACSKARFTTEVTAPVPQVLTSCKGDSTWLPTIPSTYSVNIQPNIGATTVDGQIVFNPQNTTTYTLIVQDTGKCGGVDTVVFTLEVAPNPVSDFTPSSTIVNEFDPNVTLTNASIAGVNYQWWYKGQLIASTPNLDYTLTDTGKHCFMLVTTNAAGCSDTSERCIEYINGSYVWVPNIFTPNGDDLNDVLHIKTYKVELKSFDIYNRWGERVFTTDDINKGWNGQYKGKDIEGDTYSYVIQYKDLITNKPKVYKGDVILSR
ncbi:MAG: hypothetical protein RL660_2870 [Bacteroidota bacterium]|jgi:gliding motility-associated-like protein